MNFECLQIEHKSEELKEIIKNGEIQIKELEKEVTNKNEELTTEHSKLQQSEDLYAQSQRDIELV